MHFDKICFHIVDIRFTTRLEINFSHKVFHGPLLFAKAPIRQKLKKRFHFIVALKKLRF